MSNRKSIEVASFVLPMETTYLDSRNSEQTKLKVSELVSLGHANITLEISTVSYMDSCGLNALLRAQQDCCKAGGKLVLRGSQDYICNLLHITRLDKYFSGTGDTPTVPRSQAA